METVNQRNGDTELSDILRSQKENFLIRGRLCTDQMRAYNDILHCRTSKMGSHTLTCDTCGDTRTSYNSCRNRHCPKCQYVKQLLWVEKLKCRLLPVRYFHVVFTVPEFLKPLFYLNQRECYSMLFASSALAVKKAASNPAFLGVESGCLSVLHTWGQALNYHPHIHMLVPAGGPDLDHMEWVAAKKMFFVPVKALSQIFRGIFMEKLFFALEANQLRVPEKQKCLYAAMGILKKEAYSKFWHVYIKKTFKGANQVVSYLGRYTHRVAISNSRIVSVNATTVKFRWKDYRDNKTKIMDLPCAEFIRRFMQHVLPNGFYKIRYYGIMSSANSKTKMEECFRLLRITRFISFYQGLSTYEILEEILGRDPFRCTCCNRGRMVYGLAKGKGKEP
ncbi:Transposase zinc-binding domain-containing protein [Cyclobacterium lianum]|uniref:Transposase zinc-binding domain-containing protein n=1 Tax=Cyclobacterium lianum TaxID=388280 RepID=A0A1M7QGT1_9BACT|nr:IS91 family transposase [Cyclobacterium lianum]SHN30206.1 Transposase zinc-binding domain-containing protein [Cyclobacterium lianum]